MNYHLIMRQIGSLVLLLSATLLAIWICSFAVVENFIDSQNASNLALLKTIGISAFLGSTLYLLGKTSKNKQATNIMGRKEALLLGSSSYFVGCGIAALPFWLWAKEGANEGHPFHSIINCLFESMSGLTTTGATILSDISALPDSLLFWRALIQWLGGLGIIVLFVAVLPNLGVGGRKLFRAEGSSGQPGVKPSIKETARVLWLMYAGFTGLEIVAYWAAGMNLFDATCHAFTTLATGGFSTHSDSIGAYNSKIIDVITLLFMVIAATNFGLYYAALRGRLKQIWEDPEFRCYILLLCVGSIIVSAALVGSGQPLTSTAGITTTPTAVEVLSQSTFTVVSQQTGTGFCVSDFDQWPFVAKAVLVLLMFIGGCSGSTACGLKVIRIWIAFKVLFSQLERAFRPHVIRPLKIGKNAIDDDLKLATISYLLGLLVIFSIGACGIMIFESGNSACDIATAATASLATVCNVGPGLAKVGAIENYAWLNNASKLLLCLLMAIGRLEIFAVLVLFSPKFWRSK